MPKGLGYLSRKRSMKRGGTTGLKGDTIESSVSTLDFLNRGSLTPKEKNFIFRNTLETQNPITGQTQSYGQLFDFLNDPTKRGEIDRFLGSNRRRLGLQGKSRSEAVNAMLENAFGESKSRFIDIAKKHPDKVIIPSAVVSEIYKNRPEFVNPTETPEDSRLQEILGFFPSEIETFSPTPRRAEPMPNPQGFEKGGKIRIKPENRGKFTRWAKRHGMGVQEAARHVMANKDRYSTGVIKMANFARNFGGKKKEDGGDMTVGQDTTARIQPNLSAKYDMEGVPVSFSDPTFLSILGDSFTDFKDTELGMAFKAYEENYSPKSEFYRSPEGRKITAKMLTEGNNNNKRYGGRMKKMQGGGGFGEFLKGNFDLFSAGAGMASNLIQSSKIETEQTPILARHKRTPFKSNLEETQRMSSANFQGFLDSLNVSGGGSNAVRSAGLANVLQSTSQASIADQQARNQFEAEQDRLGAGVNLANVQSQNRINALNLARRNEKLATTTGAITAGMQDFINVFSGRQAQNMQSKELMIEALKSGDTEVIDRIAKSLGMDVETFMKVLGDPNKTFN